MSSYSTMPHARAPHPALTVYYATSDERAAFVRGLFDATADDYDRSNQIFSFGTGRRYRAQALRRVGLAPGAHVLDVATGTGMVAAAAHELVGTTGSVTALDLSAEMLRAAARHPGLHLVQGATDALPLADTQFDLVTMGYALRHVGNLDLTFIECARVLRPGGRVLLLEIGRPIASWATSRPRLPRPCCAVSEPLGPVSPSGRDADAVLLGHDRELRPTRNDHGRPAG